MSEAPERIWAESVGGKWRNGSWLHKPAPDQFPDEQEFIRADLVPQWQPIETAPKDTAIIVYHHGFTIAHFNTAYGHWVGLGHDTTDTRSLKQFPPTHWMPLPNPPEAQTENDIPRTSVSAAPHLEINTAKSDT